MCVIGFCLALVLNTMLSQLHRDSHKPLMEQAYNTSSEEVSQPERMPPPTSNPRLATKPLKVTCQLVSSVTGRPLADWHVHRPRQEQWARTDEEGVFTALLAPGDYINARRKGSAEAVEGFKVSARALQQYMTEGTPLRITTTGDPLGIGYVSEKMPGGRTVEARDFSENVLVEHAFGRMKAVDVCRADHGYFVWYSQDEPRLGEVPHPIRFAVHGKAARRWRIVDGHMLKYPGNSQLVRHKITVERLVPATRLVKVVDAETSAGIHSASVRLIGRDSSALAPAPADDDGKIEIEGFVPGRYEVVAAAEGYATLHRNMDIGKDQEAIIVRLAKTHTVAVHLDDFPDTLNLSGVALLKRTKDDFKEFFGRLDEAGGREIVVPGVASGKYQLLILTKNQTVVHVEEVTINDDCSLSAEYTSPPETEITLDEIPPSGKMFPVGLGQEIDTSELTGLVLLDDQLRIPMNRPTQPLTAQDGRVIPQGVRAIKMPLPSRLYRAYALTFDRKAFFLGTVDLRDAEPGTRFTFALQADRQQAQSWEKLVGDD